MTTTNRSSYIGANKIYVGLVLLLWDVCFALQGGSSLITNTKWKLSLDVGLQPGTWMPKRYPGWAESGARLGLDVAVEFTETPFTSSEPLVGEKESTFQLKVCSTESVFVSERGQQSVTFLDGGWCIQRPTNDVRNAGGTLVKPEGLLKFWLDCPTGAKKKDVEIRPNTRIFFTTGVWDSPETAKIQDDKYREVLSDLQKIVDQTKEERNQQDGKNFLEEILSFRKMTGDAKEYDRLKSLKESLERQLPPTGAAVSSNDVKIAPKGSLVIKGKETWLPGSEYLILGTFSVSVNAKVM